jgi:hypothetical protein
MRSKQRHAHLRPCVARATQPLCRADDFQQLPMCFMQFYGATSLEELMSAMEYAAYAQDVAHVVIDNLHFALGPAGSRDPQQALVCASRP